MNKDFTCATCGATFPGNHARISTFPGYQLNAQPAPTEPEAEYCSWKCAFAQFDLADANPNQ